MITELCKMLEKKAKEKEVAQYKHNLEHLLSEAHKFQADHQGTKIKDLFFQYGEPGKDSAGEKACPDPNGHHQR